MLRVTRIETGGCLQVSVPPEAVTVSSQGSALERLQQTTRLVITGRGTFKGILTLQGKQSQEWLWHLPGASWGFPLRSEAPKGSPDWDGLNFRAVREKTTSSTDKQGKSVTSRQTLTAEGRVSPDECSRGLP